MKITKEQALVKIAELQEFIKGKEEVILVPDNIRIEKDFDDWDELWIVFNDDKQVLSYNESNGGVYSVSFSDNDDFIKCKLVKVDQGDRKVGYTYYRSDNDTGSIDNLNNYCKYLWEWKYVFITCGIDVMVFNWYHIDRYQVVPF